MSEITDDYLEDPNVYRWTATAKAAKLAGTGSKDATFWYITDFPDEMIDSDSALHDPDGGTIRTALDTGGVNQIALDILDWTPASGGISGGATAKIRLHPSTYEGATNIPVTFFWIVGGSQTQPAAGATYGSEAVYPDYGAEWKFDEDPSGTAPQMDDSTSNDNDGTSQGSMVSGDQIDLVLGSGLDFAGGTSNQCINFPDDDSLSFDTTVGAITIGLWFNVASQSGFRSMMSKRNNDEAVDAEWLIGFNQTTNIAYAAFYDGTYFDLQVSFTANYGHSTLRHIVATLQQSGSDVIITLYADGVQVGTTTHSNKTITNNTAPVNIGATKYSTASFDEEVDGTLALPFILHKLLDSDEISTLFQNQNDPTDFWDITASVEKGPFQSSKLISSFRVLDSLLTVDNISLGEVA